MLKMNNDDRKNVVMMFCADSSGCSHVRLRYYADFLNANEHLGLKAVIMPVFTFDPNILAATKAIIWQKPCTPQHLSYLQRYKALQQKYGYKLVYEIDDLFFKSPFSDEQPIPAYNTSSLRRTPEGDKQLEELLTHIFPLFDTIMCSTDYLKKVISTKYHLSNVITVKNTVPRFLWNAPKKEPLTEDIKKPTVIYSGSPCHYRNKIPAEGNRPELPEHPGDWEGVMREWVIKMVNEDKINFTVMGAMPYFFMPIANKIEYVRWANSYNYPRRTIATHADFQLAPLVPNEFNYSKSALRFYESSICGMLCIGSVFDENKNSPYEEVHPMCKVSNHITLEEFDKMFWNLCKKENYNEVLEWQYNNLNNSGLILESDEAINSFLKACDNNPQKLENI